MRTTANLIYGVTGQTLEYRVLQGRPTSATVKAFYDTGTDDDTPLWTATATVDTVNTTLTASSGDGQADRTKINADPTGIVASRKYLLQESSLKEWFTPAKIAASAVYSRHQLQNGFTTAAALLSTTLIVTVDPTFITSLASISDQLDQNPSYRLRWDILVAGVELVDYSFFDVVRAVIGPQVDIEDLNMRAPGLKDTLPVEYKVEDGRPLIDAAWQSVQAKLASIRIDTDALRDNQILDELVVLRALCMLAMGGWKPMGFESVAAYLASTTDEYNRFIEQHFQVTLQHRIAQGASGAAEPVRAAPYWSK